MVRLVGNIVRDTQVPKYDHVGITRVDTRVHPEYVPYKIYPGIPGYIQSVCVYPTKYTFGALLPRVFVAYVHPYAAAKIPHTDYK